MRKVLDVDVEVYDHDDVVDKSGVDDDVDDDDAAGSVDDL